MKVRPLVDIAYYDNEDSFDNSILTDVIDEYLNYQIRENFDLSLLEFLELPFGYKEYLYKASNKLAIKKKQALEQAQHDMNIPKK